MPWWLFSCLSRVGRQRRVTGVDKSNSSNWLAKLWAPMDAALLVPFQSAAFILLICISTVDAEEKRNPKWAQPIKLEGTTNLHKVSNVLYRSAQPDAEGFGNLKKMDVRTVVSLRSFHSDRKKIGDTGLAYEHIYMKAWHAEDHEVTRFLQIVTDPKRQPVLVHCQHGSDRTGMMCAVYRVVVEGWTKENAIKEMKEGGYGFHQAFFNLERYIQKLDIASIRKHAGLLGK